MKEIEQHKQFNLTDFLITNNTKMKGRTIFIDDSRQYTMEDTCKTIDNYCLYFKSVKCKKGDKIGILKKDSFDYICIFLAAIKLGVIPVLINIKQSNENINFIIKDSEIEVLFMDSIRKDKIVLEKSVPNVVFDLDIKPSAALYDREVTYENDIACILYTSGTTGMPKAVAHTHNNFYFCTKAYGDHILTITDKDTIYSASQLPFSFGLVAKLTLPLFYGAKAIISNNDSLYDVISCLKVNSPSLIFAVPTIFNALLRANSEFINKKELRVCVAAGEAMKEIDIINWEKKFGCKLLQSYGQTEAVFVTLSNTITENIIGSVGKPVPGYHAAIVGGDNKVLEDNHIGELVISGGSISNSKNPASPEFHTGDLFYKDLNGYFWFAGRNSETFKYRGEWINVLKLESTLDMLEGIEKTIIRGELDNSGSVELSVYISLNAAIDISALKSAIKKKLPRHLLPRKYYLVESFPHGITGKIDRNKLDDIIKKDL